MWSSIRFPDSFQILSIIQQDVVFPLDAPLEMRDVGRFLPWSGYQGTIGFIAGVGRRFE
jgi:hypothetical protein